MNRDGSELEGSGFTHSVSLSCGSSLLLQAVSPVQRRLARLGGRRGECAAAQGALQDAVPSSLPFCQLPALQLPTVRGGRQAGVGALALFL